SYVLLRVKQTTKKRNRQHHTIVEEPVAVDGNVVTSRGVGTAIAFALKLIEVLISKEKSDEIAASIVYPV
ncbi:MAG: DJ-1/PfpI family protein, partial [Anaerobutyricum hallii]